ncbi:MAG: ComF family protein [Sphingobacteriia bacterium]|nr:ComF family protein [Sphingobacteriia bacterium]
MVWLYGHGLERYMPGLWPRNGGHSCLDLPSLRLGPSRRLPMGLRDDDGGIGLANSSPECLCLWVAPSGSAAEALYKAFKFGGKRQLGPPLGAMMAAQWDGWLPPPDLLIPVPLTAKRMWSRGYNQAAELARGMAHYWSVPVMEHALKRKEGGLNLARLGRKERFAKAATDFVQGFGPTAMNKGNDLAGLRCLLVDDVMTTGATLEQCGKLLVERGALLSVMVLARRLGSKA